MSNFIELKCSNCGGDLIQNPQDNTYTCKMCGAKYLLKFEHGGIHIERILDSKLQGVQAGVNVLASEMAIQRLREDVRALTQKANKLEIALREREQELRDIPAQIKSLQAQIEKIKIPSERQYNEIEPGCLTLMLIPVLFFSLILSNGSSGSIAFLAVVVCGTGYAGWKYFLSHQARKLFLVENREPLFDKIDKLLSKEVANKKFIEKWNTQLLPLQIELADKKKELDLHMQNVKTKRE